jgi:glycosyltransferase involved in cell wall biosynthesis
MRYLVEGRTLDLRFVPALQRRLAPAADLRAFRDVFRILRQVRPRIVHTHMAKAGTIGRAAAIVCNLLSPRQRIRLVHTYHGHVLEGYFAGWQTRVFIAIERLLARFTDRLIAISPRIRADLVEQFRIGRLAQYAVVPLGFDLAPFARVDDGSRQSARATLGLAADVPVVTTTGRLTAIKQHQLFIGMARLLAARHPDAVFLIAGDGEERDALTRLAREEGVADRVRFLGWWRDLPALYAATDVFVLTSRNEGTPVALIEAMAAAVPGVATDVGGVGDVVHDAALGTLVPFGDVTALAGAVDRYLQSPDLRRETGARARSSVLARYDVERLVRDIRQLYASLEGAR